MSRRHTLTLWLAGTALALTACGGDDPEPEFTTDPTPTPTASATPVVAKETPEEFIRRWNDIDQKMQTTGDTTEYLANARDCDVCVDIADMFQEIHESGGYVDWDGRTITKVEHIGGRTYDVWFDAAPTEYRKSANSKVQTIDGGPGKNRWVLTREDDEFRMSHMTRRPR